MDNPTGSAGSSPQGQPSQPAAPTWEQEKARLEAELKNRDNQIRALSQVKGAWEKLGREAGDVIQYDANGLPVAFNVEGSTEPGTPTPAWSGASPFAALSDYGINPKSVDAYVQAQARALLDQQGYITAQQAQQLMAQAYQAARGDAMVWRAYDRLTAQEPYRDLAKPDSKLSQYTASILKERKLGEPLSEGAGFDQWRYASLEALQLGADLARLKLHEEAQAASAQAQQAGAEQAAAGLSVGQPGAGTPPPSSQAWQETLEKSPTEFDQMLREDVKRRAQQLGIVV